MTGQAKTRIVKIAVSLIIITVLAIELDLSESWHDLRGARLLPILMAIGLLAASHMVVALIWRTLLHRVGIPLGVERTVGLYIAGLVLNNFFLGSVGGDTYRVYAVYKESGAGRAALAATLLERLICVSALLMLGTLMVLVRFRDLPGAHRWILLAISGGGTCAALGLIFAPGVLERLIGPIARRATERFHDKLNGVVEAMRKVGGVKVVAALMLVAIAAQGVRIWTHWWCAQALGLDVGPGDLFVVIPIVAVAAGLPISIGGLGVREGIGALFLAPFGVLASEAVALEFLAYLVGVATSLLGGFTFLLGREISPSEVESFESSSLSE